MSVNDADGSSDLPTHTQKVSGRIPVYLLISNKLAYSTGPNPAQYCNLQRTTVCQREATETVSAYWISSPILTTLKDTRATTLQIYKTLVRIGYKTTCPTEPTMLETPRWASLAGSPIALKLVVSYLTNPYVPTLLYHSAVPECLTLGTTAECGT